MTTSLPLSKALFEKGLKIETEKWWRVITDYTPDLISSILKEDGMTYYPALSTDELLAVMPRVIVQEQHQHCVLEIRTTPNEFCICYYHPHFYCEENDKSLPEALGKMCLYLLENGYKYDEKKKMIRRYK